MMKPDDSKSPQATKNKRQKKKWHTDKVHSTTSVKVVKINRTNEVQP